MGKIHCQLYRDRDGTQVISMVPKSSVFLNLALLVPFTQYLSYYFTSF